jgi:hypothetical protein
VIRRPPSQKSRADKVLEAVCVAVVLLSLVALIAWIVTHSGGGVLNHG